MIKVYHCDTLGKRLVAEVMVTDLEAAFRMTQNIEGSWSRPRLMFDRNNHLLENPDFHPEVQVMSPLPVFGGVEYGLRSTMTGDEMELNNTRYRVAFAGFEQLA